MTRLNPIIVSLVTALAVAIAVAACGSGAAGSGTTPLGIGYHPTAPHLVGVPAGAIAVVDLTDIGRVRPTALRFASDGALSHVSWQSWGGAQASGSGTAAVLLCTPNCATGRTVDYPATIRLSDVTTCAGRRYYGQSAVSLETVGGRRSWGSFLHAPCKPPPLLYR